MANEDNSSAAESQQLHLNHSTDGTRNALHMTCEVCNELFPVKSEFDDCHCNFASCINSHAICDDCCKECRKPEHPSGRCPMCGSDSLPTPILEKILPELIHDFRKESENSVRETGTNDGRELEIPVEEIQVEMEPFSRGAFGKVYKAKWNQENVVIKAMKVDSEEQKQAVKLDANLAKTLRLSHPNVVKVFGITYMKRRQLGIVREYAELSSLYAWIGRIEYARLTEIARGIVSGLQYVHSQEIIHRDIKPQNILMFAGPTDKMIPKIADFGVLEVIKAAVKTHTRVGQELYMAPEVRLSYPHDFAADTFSLATVLFEMFNAQLIKQASADVQNFFMDVHKGKIGKIPESWIVPSPLRKPIRRGWKLNPEDRPSLSEYYRLLRVPLREHRLRTMCSQSEVNCKLPSLVVSPGVHHTQSAVPPQPVEPLPPELPDVPPPPGPPPPPIHASKPPANVNPSGGLAEMINETLHHLRPVAEVNTMATSNDGVSLIKLLAKGLASRAMHVQASFGSDSDENPKSDDEFNDD